MNVCERLFVLLLGKPHANCSRASWRNDQFDLG
jgi:hypothetical protein